MKQEKCRFGTKGCKILHSSNEAGSLYQEPCQVDSNTSKKTVENWKTDKYQDEVFNRIIDKLYLEKSYPIVVSDLSNIEESDFSPGVVVKFKWYQKVYFFIKSLIK